MDLDFKQGLAVFNGLAVFDKNSDNFPVYITLDLVKNLHGFNDTQNRPRSHRVSDLHLRLCIGLRGYVKRAHNGGLENEAGFHFLHRWLRRDRRIGGCRFGGVLTFRGCYRGGLCFPDPDSNTGPLHFEFLDGGRFLDHLNQFSDLFDVHN